jgi:hypothetical protein
MRRSVWVAACAISRGDHGAADATRETPGRRRVSRRACILEATGVAVAWPSTPPRYDPIFPVTCARACSLPGVLPLSTAPIAVLLLCCAVCCARACACGAVWLVHSSWRVSRRLQCCGWGVCCVFKAASKGKQKKTTDHDACVCGVRVRSLLCAARALRRAAALRCPVLRVLLCIISASY